MKKTVFNGIDNINEYISLFENSRVGLITNPTGVNRQLVSTADILFNMGVLRCLFSPEHGVRGNVQAGKHIDTYTDEKTSLPVYSLYGSAPHIKKEVLDGLDIVAFDIQDIGARYYTYMYTLSYAMEDCAASGKTMVVFDRINPVGGYADGNILSTEFSSFVGRYALPARHGLTIGEYARYINEKEGINCNLKVIPVKGWERSMLFSDTDLLWIPPSPNIPTPDTALCYLGTCLFEGTNLSEGRGTTRPFEFIGAPWLDGEKTAQEFNSLGLKGVKLRGCYFTPVFSKYEGQVCGGVFFHITDKTTFRPFESALLLLEIVRKNNAEFEFAPPYNGRSFIDLLFGSDIIRSPDFSAQSYLKECDQKLKEHEKNALPYYMY